MCLKCYRYQWIITYKVLLEPHLCWSLVVLSDSKKKSPRKDKVSEKDDIIEIDTHATKEDIIEIDHAKKDEIIDINTVKEDLIEIDHAKKDEILDIPSEEIIDIDIGKKKDSIIDIDIGKKAESIIDINTIRDQTSRMGKKLRGETRRLLKTVNEMGPRGYKILVVVLIIGLIGGFVVSSFNCGIRVSSLKRRVVELEETVAQYGELGLEQGGHAASGTVFGSFSINGVSWDLEGQRISIELYNTGSVMMVIVATYARRMDVEENWYEDRKQGSTESLAPMSSRTVTWTRSYADAPSGYLEPGIRYRIKVLASSGYFTEWVEVIPSS